MTYRAMPLWESLACDQLRWTFERPSSVAARLVGVVGGEGSSGISPTGWPTFAAPGVGFRKYPTAARSDE
jgi:hypothetical protein